MAERPLTTADVRSASCIERREMCVNRGWSVDHATDAAVTDGLLAIACCCDVMCRNPELTEPPVMYASKFCRHHGVESAWRDDKMADLFPAGGI